MNLTKILTCFLIAFITSSAKAQVKTGLENVKTVALKNSGTIKKLNEVRGYYFFYESDAIDKKTNEFTLQVLDENLNAAKPTKMIKEKTTTLLESATNESSVSFMFLDRASELIEYTVFNMEGKQSHKYTVPIDKKSISYFDTQMNATEPGLLSVADTSGYVSVVPVRDGNQYTYQINGFLSSRKKSWIYRPVNDGRRFSCSYVGSTDSLVFFALMKFDKLLSNKGNVFLLGLNLFTGKKTFEVALDEASYKLWITTAIRQEDNKMLLIGPYYNKEDHAMKDHNLGYGFWEIDEKGKLLKESYASWSGEVSKLLKTDEKGRLDEVGNLHTHKIVQTADGGYLVVTEGFKKVVDGGKIVMSVLSRRIGNMKSAKTTDLVLLKFDSQFAIQSAQIYDKFSTIVQVPMDFLSTPLVGYVLAVTGTFDYEFTQVSEDKSSIAVGYTDYERGKDFKGLMFHSVKYEGGNFTRDKISMKSDATWMRILPAKTGFVMIYEYHKKEKRLDCRLEKIN